MTEDELNRSDTDDVTPLETDTPEAVETAAPAADVQDDHAPQYGVGPFSIREVALGGVWLVAFVVSFFSVSTLRFDSVWTGGLQWILTIGVPTVAVFLIGLRRLSPEGIRRVGSLGIDQFASVAFSVSTVVWLGFLWETIAIALQGGPWIRSWVTWVEFFLMLAGVFLTVFAPFIAPFDEDFVGRREVIAHRNARPIRAVSPRPAPVRAAQPVADTSLAPASVDESQDYSSWAAPAAVAADTAAEPVAADEEPRTLVQEEVASTPAPQAFWALAPEERDVVDENGVPLFRIGPTAWALVIEDRTTEFVVRDEDGRVGYLRDVTGVMRG